MKITAAVVPIRSAPFEIETLDLAAPTHRGSGSVGGASGSRNRTLDRSWEAVTPSRLNQQPAVLRGTESLLTFCWREMDSNPRSRRSGDGYMAPDPTTPE